MRPFLWNVGQCLIGDEGGRRTSRCCADVLCCAVEGDGLEAFGIIWADRTANDEEEGIGGGTDADSALGTDW